MFKFVLLLALVAAAFAHWESDHEQKDYHSHPKYKFEYGVKDFKTGDNKDQWEHRDGDVVKGQYTLQEPDGTKRIVEYTSDKHGGFQAHVKRVGHAHHPQIYGHHEGGHGGESSYGDHGHGHGHASSYANLYLHSHH
ncbi:cuticle protein 19-like [Toxorhynchites rutilus septentrionalis]|uniref:cuticle protein 19-like n=1 Tax=Toxorhynchites rutilus septentrionalis TaxID=329112 RepID=UPI00247A4650|nr:cuticle protein 19-like [Toxorhynchites rutilus septentrionalis]